MNIQFYNVKSKKKVSIPEGKVSKIRYERKTKSGARTSYAVRSEADGTKLTKFVSKQDWDKLKVPEEKARKK